MTSLIENLQNAVGERYRLERELGGGGMSRVFLAVEVDLDRQVVIKVLPPEMAAEVNKERFQRETLLAASLQDPLIVPILSAGAASEAGTGSELLYYVMPFIEGESLRERLNRDPQLSIDESIHVMRDVADALAKAHDRRVVHRDIKPDNVMLSGKHAMVMDFGVAKAVSDSKEWTDAALTQIGTSLGTPMYMSPEQAAGDPSVDHRADIYSLGVVAYEMLAGRLPFEADTPQAMLAAHVTEDPTHVSQYRPSVPAPLADIVMRCLHKKPASRWQRAGDISAALDGIATATPTVTSAVNIEAFVRGSSPFRVAFGFAVAGLTLLAVVYVLMIQLGLPDWTMSGAVMLVGMTVLLATVASLSERSGNGWLSWVRGRRISIAAFGVFGVLVAGHAVMRAFGIGPVGTLLASGVLNERDRIIIAQFANSTTDSTLGETIVELLRVDLAQSPTVTLLEPTQIASVLLRMELDPSAPLSIDLAREVAEREGVKALLTGEIRSIGDDFVVSARVIAATTGETLAAARETAGSSDLINAVDKLSATLRERIGESLRTIRAEQPLDGVTTRSTQALRLYAQADRANNLGQYDRAIGLLESAIREDSLFAMAHRKLAIIMQNRNQDADRARAAFSRAYELRDRLTERERFLAEAAYYNYVQDSLQRSNDAYTSLLEKYPTDRIALNNLAVNYRQLGRIVDAEALYRRSIAQGGAPAVTYQSAIEVQYSLGMMDSALATFQAFAADYPNHPNQLRIASAMASARFDHAEAERLLRDWLEPVRGSAALETVATFELASLAIMRGKLNEARRLLLAAYDIQDEADLSFVSQPRRLFEATIESLVELWFLENPERAVQVLDGAREEVGYDQLPLQQRDDLDLAEVYARAGRLDEARRLIAAYESEPREGPEERNRSADAWAAYGTLSIVEQRYDDAVREFHEARSAAAACDICYLVELAEAHVGANAIDSAVAMYEKYLTAPMLFRARIDGFDLWGALIGLGQAHEALGNTDAALDAYNRFLGLWTDADAELQPFIDDMRNRVSRLVGEGR